MSDTGTSDSESIEAAPIPSAYLTQFRGHIQKTQLLSPAPDGSSPLDTIQSTGWTAMENDRFFAALARHSRLRPDLIASDVQTKSLSQVIFYLDTLENGCRLSGLDVSHQLEPALDVTEAFIKQEERAAQALERLEHGWARKTIENGRAEELRAFKRRISLRGTDEDLFLLESPNFERESSIAEAEESREALNQTFCDYHNARAVAWTREDALASLSMDELQVMESMTRGAEDPSQHDRGASSQRDNFDVGSFKFATTESMASTSAVGVASHNGASYAISQVDPLHEVEAPALPRTDSTLGSGPPDIHAGAVQNTLELVDLSPESRRRLTKRLHMRRARAHAKGEQPSQSLARLKPGRKKTDPKTHNAAPKIQSIDTPEQVPISTSGVTRPRKPKKRGLTKPQRIMKELRDAGLDGEILRAQGYSLFRLGALGRLMQMHSSDDSHSDAMEISGSVLRALHTQLVRFVRQLVRGTILARDQERRLKGHTAVWRLNGGDMITSSNVYHAVQISTACTQPEGSSTGIESEADESDASADSEVASPLPERESHQKVDAGTGDLEAGRKRKRSSDSTRMSKWRRLTPSVHSANVHPWQFQLHEQLHEPLVHLPREYADDTTVLLSDDEDEALAKELELDANIDDADRRKAEAAEAEQWRVLFDGITEFGGVDTEGEDDGPHSPITSSDDEELEPIAQDLRFMGPQGRVKSQVYVVESE